MCMYTVQVCLYSFTNPLAICKHVHITSGFLCLYVYMCDVFSLATMNYKIRAQMTKTDGTTETRYQSVQTDITPRSKRGLSRQQEERDFTRRTDWAEIVNLKVARAKENELERKMNQNNGRLPAGLPAKGPEIPHRQMTGKIIISSSYNLVPLCCDLTQSQLFSV